MTRTFGQLKQVNNIELLTVSKMSIFLYLNSSKKKKQNTNTNNFKHLLLYPEDNSLILVIYIENRVVFNLFSYIPRRCGVDLRNLSGNVS